MEKEKKAMLPGAAETMLAQLRDVFRKLPDDALARAARCIQAHQRIFFYGAGRSGLMLRALAMRLAQMGRTVYVVGETVTPAIEAGDLLFLASASGATPSVCRCAEAARQAGADLFVISSRSESPLERIHPADIRLDAGEKDDQPRPGQIMGSLFEQALLLFGDGVILCLSPDAAQMRKNHANLE